MKIGIHHQKGSYSDGWIDYCKRKNIPYKIVNAYDTDIIRQLSDCDIFMWHYHQMDYRDMNFAKQLLFSLQQAGKVVFPDFNTAWHFDDKLGQKYLFEAHHIQLAPSYAFYDRSAALQWASTTTYPKVFKLRGGAGSYNVKLIHSYKEAKRHIYRAFRGGWKSYDKWNHLQRLAAELFRGSTTIRVFLGNLRLLFKHSSSDLLPLHRGYVYFQDFIPNNGFDYRVEICGDKAIALTRHCRKGDFRASGSHQDDFDPKNIQPDVIQMAFDVTKKLRLQSAALDLVRNSQTGELYIVENSYCYGVDSDEFDHGYWTEDGTWHNESFNGFDWMMDTIIKQYSID